MFNLNEAFDRNKQSLSLGGGDLRFTDSKVLMRFRDVVVPYEFTKTRQWFYSMAQFAVTPPKGQKPRMSPSVMVQHKIQFYSDFENYYTIVIPETQHQTQLF